MWKSFFHGIKDLFFPAYCCFCKKYGPLICADCVSLFDICRCHRPDRSHEFLSDIFCACSYENKFVNKAIKKFKYEPFCKELGQPLAQTVIDHFCLAQINAGWPDAVIVPLPLAQKRIRWRGFNQSEIIARHLSFSWKIPLVAGCLERKIETVTQTGMGAAKRRINVKGAFRVSNAALIKDKTILLVDDIVTTGATMEECGRVLLKNGARKIIGISIARAEK